jgi:hypothetical protein
LASFGVEDESGSPDAAVALPAEDGLEEVKKVVTT